MKPEIGDNNSISSGTSFIVGVGVATWPLYKVAIKGIKNYQDPDGSCTYSTIIHRSDKDYNPISTTKKTHYYRKSSYLNKLSYHED